MRVDIEADAWMSTFYPLPLTMAYLRSTISTMIVNLFPKLFLDDTGDIDDQNSRGGNAP